MALFTKAEVTNAYLKMGIYGEAGSGKTFTASQIAKGLALLIASKGKPKPKVMFLDTETGATWVRPIFETAGIEFLVHSSRSFADLKASVVEAEAAGAILIVDSMTHFWEEIREAYVAAKRKRLKNEHARLELPDWNVIKPAWGQFTSLYLNSSCHILLCGRAGSTYEFQEDEETHKKTMITTGTRMAAEKGMGYEPNLLVEMTARQVMGPRKSKSIVRTATVLKDRSDVLDGVQFDDPTFENFLPHIERLNLGGKNAGFDVSRTSEGMFPAEGEARDIRVARRKVALGDIQDLLVLHIPGQAAADKKRKIELLHKHFKAGWTEMEELMPLEQLQMGFRSLKEELEPATPLEQASAEKPIDEIPHLEPKPAEAKAETVVERLDDRDTIIRDFERELKKAKTAKARQKVWNGFAEARLIMDEPRLEKMRSLFAKQLTAGVHSEALQAAE
jgi:hypothetical protein